jgi:hypothetical protein
MLINRLILIALLLLTLLPVSANSLRIFNLGADEWARPRTGTVIPNFGALRSAIDYWEKGINAAILIRYPGEDSGEIWASELRDWFISLGVPSDYIMLVPGSQDVDEITLIVGNREELEQ